MTSESSAKDEPLLVIRPRPGFWTRRFTQTFTPVACMATVGLVLLAGSGNLLVPFESSVVLEGKTGSKGEIFADKEVQRLLQRQHIQVHVTRTGSREIATHDFSSLDFVFPSGQPAAQMIIDQLGKKNIAVQTRKPFASPLVLATYRQYAETLVKEKIATPQGPDQDKPLYYTLKTREFVDLMHGEKTWNQINVGNQHISNGNRVLAQSPSMCTSNSGEAYVALLAYAVKDTNAPPTVEEAEPLGNQVKPYVRAQGLQEGELFTPYLTPEGPGTAPIIVVYEHQYLAYQIARKANAGTVDTERVLLYPDEEMQTDPEFIALNSKAEQLATALANDAELRQRIMELGYRLQDPNGAKTSEQLWQYLRDRQIPVPSREDATSGTNFTRAALPEVPALEKLISTIGGCPQ